MILIQKRYRDDAEEINEGDIDRVEITVTMYKKVCCGHKEKKVIDLGWISEPKDMQLSNVKEYSIEARILSVFIEL
ncbi:hypothetical protein ACT9XH_02000 [Methanococcoides methylutens]|uniref:hypothetical protein n=1 Tax=Methanococcoides methylutens TaxID=2226 RepID=UPI004044C4BB